MANDILPQIKADQAKAKEQGKVYKNSTCSKCDSLTKPVDSYNIKDKFVILCEECKEKYYS